MLHIDVGLSAIRASQQALYAISNNVANANTEGYHRQRVELVDRNPVTIGSIQIGTGVEVERLSRLRDTATEGALVSTNSLHAESETFLEILGQIESALLPTQGSLIDSVSNFFNELEQLAAQPSTVTIRDAVVAAAEDVVKQVERLDSRINQLRTNNAIEVAEEVDAVNQATAQIAELNRDIRILSHSGTAPNILLDQRDRLVSQLSTSVEISLQTYLVEESPLVAANGAVLIAEEATQLVAVTSLDGHAAIETQSGGQPVKPLSGKLAGLLSGQELIDSVQQSLHDWATEFVQHIDQIHSTGLGHNQSNNELQGSRPVADASVPLTEAGSPFDIASGSLFVTLTDTLTSQRSTQRIDVDVETDSLDDVLNQLDALANLSAIYQPDAKQVLLRAAGGYSVDFAGGIDAVPQSSTLTGTAIPRLSGFPTGKENKNWTATVLGTGTVGITTGLEIEVTDTVSGDVIRTISVGDDYLPGETIELGDGVQLRLNGGTLNSGETFQFDLVANPDETGLLVALGLNTLFSGEVETGLRVNSQILESPLNIAASRTGLAADATNLSRLIELRDSTVFVERNETIEQRLASIATVTAFQIEAEQASLEYLNERKVHLENVRDSVSGVDVNEELLNMLEFQRQFRAASRFVTAVDESLDELMRLIS